MVRPLSMKERGEIIGLALDIDADIYNDYLSNDSLFPFEGSASHRRVAAAICLIYDTVDEDYYKETNDSYLRIWGRAVMYTTKHGGNSILRIFSNRKKAQAEFNKEN
jgi:hypothetical protein